MKILLIILVSTIISVSGIYVLREKVFKLKEIAPEINLENISDFYKLSAKDIDGNVINFSKYKGKKLLIVNVASKCGYTNQYKDLQELHKRYNDKVTILAFPSNNFGFQEPGTNNEIEEFCETNYGIELELFGELMIQLDYFTENRNKIYESRPVFPDTAGLTTVVSSNTGKVKSNGFDVAIDFNKSFSNDFFITGRGTLTYATNEVVVSP